MSVGKCLKNCGDFSPEGIELRKQYLSVDNPLEIEVWFKWGISEEEGVFHDHGKFRADIKSHGFRDTIEKRLKTMEREEKFNKGILNDLISFCDEILGEIISYGMWPGRPVKYLSREDELAFRKNPEYFDLPNFLYSKIGDPDFNKFSNKRSKMWDDRLEEDLVFGVTNYQESGFECKVKLKFSQFKYDDKEGYGANIDFTYMVSKYEKYTFLGNVIDTPFEGPSQDLVNATTHFFDLYLERTFDWSSYE